MLTNNIIRLLILPPVSLLLLYAAGVVLGRRRPRAGAWTRRAAVALLLLLSTSFVGLGLLRPLENLEPALRDPAAHGAQAIVVLAAGSMVRAPEYGDEDVPDHLALARLRYGARLQHQTGLPLLVSGGVPGDARPATPLAVAMERALREDFRTPVRWVEAVSLTTAENATFSSRLLAAGGARKVLLVTDAMHMARARLVFERAGLEVVPAPTSFFSTRPFSFPQLLPSTAGLTHSYYALYEWFGLVWYRLRH